MSVPTSTPQDSATPENGTSPEDSATPQADSQAEPTPAPTGQDQAASNQTASNQTGAEPSTEDDKPKRGRPRKQSTARKTRSVELVLTVTGTMDGDDWQAELKHGTDRVVSGLPIAASAVSRAAKELHEDISSGIETVLGAAREQHRSRLEELEAEMRKVKQALADLEE